MPHAYFPLLLLLAAILDAVVGDPPSLWRRVPHPVVWIGALIAATERTLNRGGPLRRRGAGVIALALWLAIGIGGTLLVLALVPPWAGAGLTLLGGAILLAQRSLADHARAVAEGLDLSLDAGRAAVSRIVGRDPESLDEAGVARAAVESVAENFSDGFTAPLFWFALFGLPGIVGYKIINTADSMVGHLSPRYAAFGWASARLDDLVNLIPARLSGALIVLVAALSPDLDGRQAVRAMRTDARRHRSPNAGWPEAAMAGALGLALAGPRRYGAEIVDDAWMNTLGRREATAANIRRAVRVMRAAAALAVALAVIGTATLP
ncbi:adenosylcobinamide-phosphate synthase CbiB [Elstera sp.]|jgi:adenosylcobinamide-phosphate synthase|uniref:adenosylcobinamide-phosphate synthase CbiB n=1 Tax=Elstera sp. TaxID=1916664 RepID=UPI0037BED92D